MTIVEFFDFDPIENAIGALVGEADKIIFVGECKPMKRFESRLQTFLSKRKLNARLCFISVNKTELDSLVKVLSDIVKSENSCIFDLTGGDGLSLVAMGMVYERFPTQVTMLNCNVSTGRVRMYGSSLEISFNCPAVSIEESIALHGGIVKYDKSKYNSSIEWSFSQDFISDIEKIWLIARKNPSRWNSLTGTLASLSVFSSEGALSLKAQKQSVDERLLPRKTDSERLVFMLDELSRAGLVNVRENQSEIELLYKNHQIKKLLTTAGTALELKILCAARAATHKDKTPYFSDCADSVVIEWAEDRADRIKSSSVYNEIDVVLIKGITSIFVSCKFGRINDDELYKLDTVAEEFGGRFSKKALITAGLSSNVNNPESFRKRASEMKIALIEDVHKMSDRELEAVLKSI